MANQLLLLHLQLAAPQRNSTVLSHSSCAIERCVVDTCKEYGAPQIDITMPYRRHMSLQNYMHRSEIQSPLC